MNISTNWSFNSSAGCSIFDLLCDDGYCIFLAACVLNVLLSFPVNSYVIWLIATGTGNGLAAEFFSLHLSVSEILLSLDCFLYLGSVTSTLRFLIAAVIGQLVITSRSLFLSLMCVERFLAVVHPLTFLKLKPLRYRIFCAVVVWTVSLVALVVSAVGIFLAPFNTFIYFTLPHLVFCLSVQIFCLVSVLRALKQPGPGERKEENHRKRRAFRIMCVIFLTLVVTYVPFIIFTSLLKRIPSSVIFFGYACLFLSSLLVPVLFLQRVKKLRLICCCWSGVSGSHQTRGPSS